MKLGAQLFSVRNATQTPEGIHETFRKIKAIGYENVQVSGTGPIEAERLHAISEETELPIVCTHSTFDRIVNDTDALINEHKIFGCPVIGLGAMPKEMRDGGREGLETFFSILSEPSKKILDAGLHFAYHNHGFEFKTASETDGTMYDEMLRRCSDWHFIMDTYWVQYAGYSPIEYIAKIGSERLVNIHFKDMANNEKRSICPCGHGVLDFVSIYETCKKTGVQNVLIEQDNAPDSPDAFADMETSFRHLRPIIK